MVIIDSDIYLIELRYRRDARYAINAHFVVTWNARLFKDKTSLAVLTPTEYLTGQADM